jgi:hypothetical protein
MFHVHGIGMQYIFYYIKQIISYVKKQKQISITMHYVIKKTDKAIHWLDSIVCKYYG